MRLVPAERVIGERLDDAAIADAAMAAFLDHAAQLGAQGNELLDPALDLGEAAERDAVGGVAGGLRLRGERQQFADRLDLETEIACMPDEGQALCGRLVVDAAVALGARNIGQDADLLVVPDGRHLDAGAARQSADREVHARNSHLIL